MGAPGDNATESGIWLLQWVSALDMGPEDKIPWFWPCRGCNRNSCSSLFSKSGTQKPLFSIDLFLDKITKSPSYYWCPLCFLKGNFMSLCPGHMPRRAHGSLSHQDALMGDWRGIRRRQSTGTSQIAPGLQGVTPVWRWESGHPTMQVGHKSTAFHRMPPGPSWVEGMVSCHTWAGG